MELLVRSLYEGLAYGSIYALAALGFAFVYNTTGVFHIAAGGIGVVGALIVVSMADLWPGGSGFSAGMALAILVSVVLSVVTYLGIYRPLYQRQSDRTVVFVASLGVEKIIESVAHLVFGSTIRSFDILDWLRYWSFFGMEVSYFTLFCLAFGLIATVSVVLLLSRSSWGHRVHAVAANRELAELMGFRTEATIVSVFVASAVLSLAGSVLYGMNGIVQIASGVNLVLIASLAVLIGGRGSYLGAYVAGLLLGITQIVVATIIPGEWAVVAVFGLFFVVVLLRPHGLLGASA
jgi:branched-chain amino acid transport system permease protein